MTSTFPIYTPLQVAQLLPDMQKADQRVLICILRRVLGGYDSLLPVCMILCVVCQHQQGNTALWLPYDLM